MSETQFLGYFVVAVVTLGGFIGVISKFTQPINELRLVVQKLNDKLDTLSDNHKKIQEIVDDYETRLNNLDGRVGKIETKIDMYHKE